MEFFEFIQNIDSQVKSAIAAFSIIVGLIHCYFGFKIFKLELMITAFLTGLALGGIAFGILFEDAGIGVLIGGFCGFLLAFLAYKLYRLSVFIGVASVTFIITFLAFLTFEPEASLPVGIVAGLIIGFIAVFLVKPTIIISTAVSSAVLIGVNANTLFDEIWIAVVLGLLCGITGIIVQFCMNRDINLDGGEVQPSKLKWNKHVVGSATLTVVFMCIYLCISFFKLLISEFVSGFVLEILLLAVLLFSFLIKFVDEKRKSYKTWIYIYSGVCFTYTCFTGVDK